MPIVRYTVRLSDGRYVTAAHPQAHYGEDIAQEIARERGKERK